MTATQMPPHDDAPHVLVVDDDRRLRVLLSSFLRKHGYRVTVAASAAEARAFLGGLAFEIIVLDVMMPGENGLDLAASLRQRSEIPILMLTVYEDTDQIFKALAAGASGYLLKRSSPAKLLHAIREVHTGGSPMTSSIARKVVASFQKPKQTGEKQTQLSTREEAVLVCLAKGLTYKQIADQLGLSIDTIRTYLRRIYEKLHVQSRTEAVAKYLSH